MHLSSTLALTSLCAVAHARIVAKPIPHPLDAKVNTASATNGAGTFQQLLDHSDPSKGTFSQRYWWNAEFWTGEGSPVVLFTPGEEAADGYLGYLYNETISGLFGQEINGAVLLLEHRYWGESSPYTELNAETLQYLNVKNAMADLMYFANTVDLPFDTDFSSNAQNAPWVMTGGSYSGALTAWMESVYPGTFWAYHASSAPVETIYDYWQYFVPVQEGMAKNCSADVSRVIDYIDGVNKSGDQQKIQDLKNMFGLGDLEFDDFACALESPMWFWQNNEFYTGYSDFFYFCDYIENVLPGAANVPSADGVGLEKALQGYVKWWNEVYFPGSCASYGYWTDQYTTECYDSHNASSPLYTDTSVYNTVDRQWMWLLCNEPLFYWEDGAPENHPSIVSRAVTAEYWQRQCPLYFPEVNGYTYGSAQGKGPDRMNRWTQGWDITSTTRLTWTNGQLDPWREASVSSEYRPGGPLQSRPSAPVLMIPDGIHCSDLLLANGWANKGVQQVIDTEVAHIKAWVAEYYQQ